MAKIPPTPQPLEALVSPIDLAQREVQVELCLPADILAAGAVLALPAWTPGSYLIRDYSRFLDRLTAMDAQGRPVTLEKLDKQRWRVPPGKGPLVVRYRLFCNELTVRTNHVDATHAHLVGAATFLYAEGQERRPWKVTFRGWPEAWGVACSLPKEGEAFLARDLDTLVDSPFELGTFRTHCFHAGRGRGTEPGRPVGSAKGMEGAPPLAGGRGCEFRLVVTGEHPGDEERMVQGARAVVEACGDLFGGFPFENYLFLLTFSPKARGGLEHRDCTSLLADPFTLDRPEGYWDLFLLMAHEFFHVWNVKRMRDAVLGPFDYQRENPTRLLWFHEGFTSFMQYTLVLRAGVAPWSWVARKLASSWTENVTRAGRWEQSLEESSFDAWIRHYKPSEFSSNSTVSYYDMGSMVAWMMDARIRQATGGAQGLDRFFALLWERVGDAPLTDAVLRQTYGELAGEDPGPFWDAHIRGVEPLDPAPIEEAYGLSLAGAAPWERPPVEEGGDPRAQRRARAWSGLEFGGPGNEVRFVVPGSPAAQAGLSYGMEVLAVGGWRTTCRQEVLARLGDHGPGETVEILACDRGRVRAHPLCLGENPNRTYLLSADPGANPRQRAAFQAWTGQAFPTNLPASRGQS